MSNSYLTFFEDLDDLFHRKFESQSLDLSIIGYTALALAGLPDRGTKDIDALKTEALTDPAQSEVLSFLSSEFGKGRPGAIRNDLYLDLVERQIPWIPPSPRFQPALKLQCVSIQVLHPADVCVSKTFANFKGKHDRGNDRKDVLDALDYRIVDIDEYLQRLDQALSRYEIDALAPEIFRRVLRFVEEDLLPNYGDGTTGLRYQLPGWMENI